MLRMHSTCVRDCHWYRGCSLSTRRNIEYEIIIVRSPESKNCPKLGQMPIQIPQPSTLCRIWHDLHHDPARLRCVQVGRRRMPGRPAGRRHGRAPGNESPIGQSHHPQFRNSRRLILVWGLGLWTARLLVRRYDTKCRTHRQGPPHGQARKSMLVLL